MSYKNRDNHTAYVGQMSREFRLHFKLLILKELDDLARNLQGALIRLNEARCRLLLEEARRPKPQQAAQQK